MNTAELFDKSWAFNLEERLERSPSFTEEQFTITGKAAAAYGGKRNRDWWFDHGPKMIDNWVNWRKEHGWILWETPDGEPAIELELNIILPGDIPVKMVIDRIFVLPSGLLAPVDLKTGSRMPEFPEQLGLYATGMELAYGPEFRPQWGFYWDAQKGTHGQPQPLDMYTPQYLSALYSEAIAGINAGSFLAKPANSCQNWCGQSRHCAAVGGAEAHIYDPALNGKQLTLTVKGEMQ